MNRTTEDFVRRELLPYAGEIFSGAAFSSPDCDFLHKYTAVAVVLSRSTAWELGFIPCGDIFGSSTRGGFLYSVSTNSLLGPFWCLFQNGRWEQYLVND